MVGKRQTCMCIKGVLCVAALIGLLATATPTMAVGGEDCATATAIAGLPYSDLGVTTVGFLDDYDAVCPYTGSTSPDAVYSYTPAVGETVDISLCGAGTAYDTKLYVYAGACTSGTEIACNDDSCPGFISELLGVVLTGGTTYYIVVDGYGGASGVYDLSITALLPAGACCYFGGACTDEPDAATCTGLGGTFQGAGTDCLTTTCPLPPPANDTCATAELMTFMAGGSASVIADNTDATDDATATCGTTAPGHGMWYTVVGTGNTITATTCSVNTTFDTKIQVFCDCVSMFCVGGNDDDCGLQSTVTWCSSLGQSYYIHVGGFSTATGTFELTVSDDGLACAPAAPCSPPTGSCCTVAGLPPVDTCVDAITEADCLLDVNAVWTEAAVCSGIIGDDCPVGRCCTAGVCDVISLAACNLLGGTWDAGLDCALGCLSGACCYTDGSCTVELDAATCLGLGGVFQTVGSTCATVNCPQPPAPNDTCATAIVVT